MNDVIRTTMYFSAEALESNAQAKDVLRRTDSFRDARRVLEGWGKTILTPQPIEEGKPELLGLAVRFRPFSHHRDYLTAVAQHLADVIAPLRDGEHFHIMVAPHPEATTFVLYFSEAKDAPKMQRKIQAHQPELLEALQVACKVSDEVAAGRVH